jgi:N-acyl homoserine lactone hydrolase
MNATDPVRRVSVLSTGQVQIHLDHEAATWRPIPIWLLTSRRWTAPRPINAYVMEHRDGLVLFDTGQDRASVTDPGYFPGGVTRVLYDRLARFEIGPQQTLTAGLDRLGYAAGDVTIHSPGRRWRRITPEAIGDPALAPFRSGHDLFGDGSLLLLPTPGHTPGSVSLLVRRAGLPPLLMVGDMTYDADLLQAGHVPGVGSRRRLRIATAMVNQLRQQLPGLVILPAHDPGAVIRLAEATGPAPAAAAA